MNIWMLELLVWAVFIIAFCLAVVFQFSWAALNPKSLLMTGFWSTLTEEQKLLARQYEGNDTHGAPRIRYKEQVR